VERDEAADTRSSTAPPSERTGAAGFGRQWPELEARLRWGWKTPEVGVVIAAAESKRPRAHAVAVSDIAFLFSRSVLTRVGMTARGRGACGGRRRVRAGESSRREGVHATARRGRRRPRVARHAVRLLPSRALGREPAMDPTRAARSGGLWLAGGQAAKAGSGRWPPRWLPSAAGRCGREGPTGRRRCRRQV
jgi:hypothetical protein